MKIKKVTKKATKANHSTITATEDMDHLEGFFEQRSEDTLMPLRLVGTSPILMHAWGQKALLQMLGKMTGHDIPQTEKDLVDDYEQAFYRNTKEAAVLPCRIIKRCILDGALATKKAVFKTDLGKYLRVEGLTAPIVGEPHMDIRTVSIGGQNRKPDIRSRPMFDEWSVEVVIRFAHKYISADKVLMAVRSAGDAVGLCEWRPSSKQPGVYGCFTVENVEVARVPAILAACKWPEKPIPIPPAFLRAAGADLKKVPKEAQNAVGALVKTKKANGAGALA